MAESAIEAKRRAEWERLRAGGLRRFLVVRGVLWRGLPMAVLVAVLLATMRDPRGAAPIWRDPGFLVRFALAVLFFSVGGMLSAYARWRALETRFGGEQRPAAVRPKEG
jgi:hypothetical protein